MHKHSHYLTSFHPLALLFICRKNSTHELWNKLNCDLKLFMNAVRKLFWMHAFNNHYNIDIFNHAYLSLILMKRLTWIKALNDTHCKLVVRSVGRMVSLYSMYHIVCIVFRYLATHKRIYQLIYIMYYTNNMIHGIKRDDF